jgi:hypothetical protein
MRPPVGATIVIEPEIALFNNGQLIERNQPSYCVVIRWMQFGNAGRYCAAKFVKDDPLYGMFVFLHEDDL